MEGWKQTEIGLMPKEWKVDRIDKFFSIQQGKQVSKKNRIGENQRPFLRTRNVFWGRMDLEELDEMNFTSDEVIKFQLKKGDLLVCEGGSVGRSAILNNSLNNCYYQNHLHRVRRLSDDTNPEFACFWLEYGFEYGKIYFGRANETTLSNLSKSRLAELNIPQPPLLEQRKIAYVLNTVQKAIEKQDQLIKTTTELKKALMQKIFNEGLPEFRRKMGLYGEPQKETEIGLVPESWEVMRLGKYAYIENGYAFKSVDYVKDGIPLIRISNVSHGYLIDKDNKYLPEAHFQSYSKFALRKGDLIISLTRPVTSGGLKYCFIEEKHLPALLNQRVGRFQVRDNKRLSKDFLYHLVFTQYFVGELFRLFGGSSQQPNVSPTQLENFKVPIPNFEEQKEIAKSIFALNKKVSIAKKKKQTLTSLFKTLLHELMTGQRRVHELEFEGMVKEYELKKQSLSMAAEE